MTLTDIALLNLRRRKARAAFVVAGLAIGVAAVVARAIVNRPPLLLAGEPTGNLDSHNGRRVTELLKDLSRDGVTVVMVTHSRECAGYAHRILHMSDGQIAREELVRPQIENVRETERVPALACCTLVLEVPLTTEQQTRQKSEHLYAGTLPEKGAPLEIVGTLRQVGAGYSFRVIRVTSGGKEIIKRV